MPLDALATQLGRPQLHDDITKFLLGRLFPDGDYENDVAVDEFPHISPCAKVGTHLSATIVFHAPSEISGLHGMWREIIHCNPSWYRTYPRFDTVFVTVDPTTWGMSRFRAARLQCLILVPYDVF